MPILSDEWIDKLYRAVVTADMTKERDTLREGIDAFYLANLREQESPGEQVLSDLRALNQTNYRLGSKRPMETWLGNAVSLAGARVEAAVMKAALAEVQSVPVDPTPPDPPKPDARGTGGTDKAVIATDPGDGKSQLGRWAILGAAVLAFGLAIAAVARPRTARGLLFSGSSASPPDGGPRVPDPPPTDSVPGHGAPPEATLFACESPVLGQGASRRLDVLVVPIAEQAGGWLSDPETLRAVLCAESASLRTYLEEVAPRTLDFRISLAPPMTWRAEDGAAARVAGVLPDLDERAPLSGFDRDRDGLADAVIFVPGLVRAPEPPEVLLRDAPGVFHTRDGRAIVDRAFIAASMVRDGPPRLGELVRAVGLALGLSAEPARQGFWTPMGMSWQEDFPPHFSGPEKAELGWAAPIDVDRAGDYNLAQGQMLRIAAAAGTSYLFEHRASKSQFDAAMPSGGVLLWKVNGRAEELLPAAGPQDLAASEGRRTVPFYASSPGRDLPGAALSLTKVQSLPDGRMRVTLAKPKVAPAVPRIEGP